MNNPTIQELITLAKAMTENEIAGNNSITAITGNWKTFIEKWFSGCGGVSFRMHAKHWRIAKSLWAKKWYEDYNVYSQYYNGQLWDASRAFNIALHIMQEKYPNDIVLKKIYLTTWDD